MSTTPRYTLSVHRVLSYVPAELVPYLPGMVEPPPEGRGGRAPR